MRYNYLKDAPEKPTSPYAPPSAPRSIAQDKYSKRLFDLFVRTLPVRRPSGSPSEKAFLQDHFQHVWLHPCAHLDDHGNFHVWVHPNYPDAAPSPSTPTNYVLWSAHTDDVSTEYGWQRRIAYDADTGCFHLHKSETNLSGLGADNLCGIVLLSEMIRANVPGYYIFHAQEERGRVGSEALAKQLRANGGQLPLGNCWVSPAAQELGASRGQAEGKHRADQRERIVCAIAFDRRSTTSIITHQMGVRCTSDVFAAELSKRLGENYYMQAYAPDDGGSYTDTASYVDLIGECTNVSVGTQNEHAASEQLDFDYFLHLARRMVRWTQADTDLLAKAATRQPGEPDPEAWGYDDCHYYTPAGRNAPRQGAADRRENNRERDQLERLILDRPDLVTAFLLAQGFVADDIEWFEQDLFAEEGEDDDREDDGSYPGVTHFRKPDRK